MKLIPSRGTAYYRIRRIARRTRIPHSVLPQAVKSIFTTLRTKKGFNAFELMSTMGWNSIKTTQDYIKLSRAAGKQTFKEK